MKYRRRKTNISKYISKSEDKMTRKKTPKIFLILLFVPLFITLISPYILPGTSLVSKTLTMLKKTWEGGASYISDKMSFMSRLGEKGAYFCFEYMRDNKKNTALAVNSVESGEKVVDLPLEITNTETEEDTLPNTENNISFSPSMPCDGSISSPFGERIHPLSGAQTAHNGIDIAVGEGTDVFAIEDGTIEKSEYNQISGNFIVIQHKDGYTSSYAHLSKSLVNVGDRVKKGSLIGASGSTGAVTGPHLHMEIRKDTVPVDPINFLKVN